MEDALTRIGTTAAATAIVYVVALAGARVAGRRTLARMSAFDIVVTIAIGTIVGSTALSRGARLLEGVTSLLALFTLQLVIGVLRRSSPRIRNVVDFRPLVVVRDGQVQQDTLAEAHMTPDDLRGRLRRSGRADVPPEGEVILEPTGEVTVREGS